MFSSLIAFYVTCVASVSVGLGSKERPRNGILPARNWGESQNKRGSGGGEGRKRLQPNPWSSPANGARDWLDQSNIIDMCRSSVDIGRRRGSLFTKISRRTRI